MVHSEEFYNNEAKNAYTEPAKRYTALIGILNSTSFAPAAMVSLPSNLELSKDELQELIALSSDEDTEKIEPAKLEVDNHEDSSDDNVKHLFDIIFNANIEGRIDSQNPPVSPDPFNIAKPPLNPLDEQSQKVFNTAVKSVIQYASTHKHIFRQLQDAEKTVSLPAINSNNKNTVRQLHLLTVDNGTNVIHMSGAIDAPKSGFFLAQEASGEVTIIDALLKNAYTYKNKEYGCLLEAVGGHLNKYFEQLKVAKSANTLGGDSLYEIRENLGALPTRRARRLARKALEQ